MWLSRERKKKKRSERNRRKRKKGQRNRMKNICRENKKGDGRRGVI